VYQAPPAPVQPPVFEQGPNYDGKDFGPSDLYGMPQPVQQPLARDPMYAGMPDDMYNNMMADRQRKQAFADQNGGLMIESPVERPWDRWMYDQRNPLLLPAPVEQPSWVNETTTIANPLSQIPVGEQYNTIAGPGPVAPTPTPGLPSWMPPDTTTIAMPNGATGYNINGMIYDQTGSIISSGVGPVAP
jgi:hypothetical protein